MEAGELGLIGGFLFDEKSNNCSMPTMKKDLPCVACHELPRERHDGCGDVTVVERAMHYEAGGRFRKARAIPRSPRGAFQKSTPDSVASNLVGVHAKIFSFCMYVPPQLRDHRKVCGAYGQRHVRDEFKMFLMEPSLLLFPKTKQNHCVF